MAVKYYLLVPLEGVRNPEIADYNEAINYKAFIENKPVKMKARTICTYRNEADFGEVLLTPLPLFKETLKRSLELFLWDCEYKEIIFLDQREGGMSHFYFLPFFYPIPGEIKRTEGNSGEPGETTVYLEEPLPEDIPVIYLAVEKKRFIIMRLDLAESLIRNGLCGVRLHPVALSERRESYG